MPLPAVLKHMEVFKRSRMVSFRPRLAAVAEMLRGLDTVADIGCDHGRLGIGMLQRGYAKRIIAADISAASLEKACSLAAYTGHSASMGFRVGSGLSVLRYQEADGIALCGMGGELISELLMAASPPFCGAKRAAMQPMRGAEELRRYLFEHTYRIVSDVIVRDANRLYQVILAEPGPEVPFTDGWPEGFFTLGYHARSDPLFPALVRHMHEQCEKRLREAKGSQGEKALQKRLEDLKCVMRFHSKPDQDIF